MDPLKRLPGTEHSVVTHFGNHGARRWASPSQVWSALLPPLWAMPQDSWCQLFRGCPLSGSQAYLFWSLRLRKIKPVSCDLYFVLQPMGLFTEHICLFFLLIFLLLFSYPCWIATWTGWVEGLYLVLKVISHRTPDLMACFLSGGLRERSIFHICLLQVQGQFYV